jgi:hypothetical protein
MADEHSEPGGMKVLRLYADSLGESRFEATTKPMALKEFAPPAAPFRVSAPQPGEFFATAINLRLRFAGGDAVRPLELTVVRGDKTELFKRTD